jgi:hypothetical protein
MTQQQHTTQKDDANPMTSRTLQDVANAMYDGITTGGITDLRYMAWPLKNTVYNIVTGDCYSEGYGPTAMFVYCVDDLGAPESFDELIELADVLASLDVPLDTH